MTQVCLHPTLLQKVLSLLIKFRKSVESLLFFCRGYGVGSGGRGWGGGGCGMVLNQGVVHQSGILVRWEIIDQSAF